MKTIPLSEAKDHLSRYVARVRSGESVRILVRGVPVADLVPVGAGSDAPADEEAELEELERLGVIRRGRGSVPKEIFRPGPRARGRPLSELIIEERRSGR